MEECVRIRAGKMAAAAGSSVALMGTLGKSPMGMGGTLRPLAPEEIACRLRNTRRELSNRRKILLRNLPLKSSSQEIHDLLKGFELKYCYVDKNKRTAFFTLLNGEQAQNVIRLFHQHSLQGKDLSVQLQPTDALLCITNLPTSCTLQEFEHLVQPYGNVERHFLIYGEITGYSKGYGFVEYMKRDSAAKARLDHLGKQLRGNILLAQWMDVNLLTPELIHSKCLCVENLPTNCIDAEDLMQTFSTNHKSVFYQVRNNRKALLPDPNAVQIMKNLNTPAMLQMLLQPQLHGCVNKLVLGTPLSVPHLVSPSISPAFLHLSTVHQKLSLLGEPPVDLPQTMLGMGTVPPVTTDMGNQGEAHNLSDRTPTQTPVAMGMGMVPFFPNPIVVGQAMPRQNNTQDKLPLMVGSTEDTGSGSQAYLQSLTNATAGGLRAGHFKPQSQPNSNLGSSSNNQTSLLGDPPKEIHLSTNPYLNLASVLPSVCLSVAQVTTSQQAVENCFNYPTQYGDYTQDSVQQWYQQYAQAYRTIQARVEEIANDRPEESDGGVYCDYSNYLQVIPSCYAPAQGSFHPGILPLTPQNPLKMAPIGNEKQGSSYLISTPEDGRVDYLNQQAQGSMVHYAELYLKRKRVY